jgi:hypothetical protein
MEQCSTMIKSSMLLPDHGNYFDCDRGNMFEDILRTMRARVLLIIK